MNTERLCTERLSKIVYNKQVLVYGVLELTNDLRSVFVGHIYFKKLLKFLKFIEIFHCCMTGSGTRNKISFNHIDLYESL